MANEIEITIRGNAGAAPVIHEGPNGGVAARFSVAASTSKYNSAQNEVVNSEAQWFRVKTFGAQARNVARSVQKGTPVLVRGELLTEHWQTADGEPRSTQVIRADTVAVALNNGIANYCKVVHGSALGEDPQSFVPRDVSSLTEVDSPEGAPADSPEGTPVDVPGNASVDVTGGEQAAERRGSADPDDPFTRDGGEDGTVDDELSDEEPVLAGAPAPGAPF